ncbi:MAG: hypothetical protein KAT28_02690 [Candidatus Aenigmarchaeota archaeon]|nr:hypothetical protein [Candidatus Aenigmarchaeota archaeon]
MILVDTNVFLEYKKLKLFFSVKELAITRPCLIEVKKFSEEKKDRVLSELIDTVKVIETKEKIADKSIIEAGKKYKWPVATYDLRLVRKLNFENVVVLGSSKAIMRELN